MIDFHSHILPAMDDGSKNVEESLALLNLLKQQGIDTVVATPHYYADRESVQRFLQRREKAYNTLKKELTQELPQVLLGAEVRYYDGISHLSDLNLLRIEGSKLLLLEMPFVRWTEYTVKELVELSCSTEIKILLAHIERYLSLQNGTTFERLCDNGLLIQVNASFFNSVLTRRKAIRMLEDGSIDAVGSDCHNLATRPPMLDKAYENIVKKLGTEFKEAFTGYSDALLEKYKI